jgi:arsenate reductase (thioredoxin)
MNKNVKILILCTGNSCRSQMAQGFLRSLDKRLQVFSAGTEPASGVHPVAIRVMKEIGFDISRQKPRDVNEFLNQKWDYVITVCDNANETCPVFSGKVDHRIHIGFEDPSCFIGTEEQIMNKFRAVRDEIVNAFNGFYNSFLI